MKTTTKKSSTSTPKKSTTKKSGNASAQGLKDLFEDMLKDIYWAEKALLKALPKMAKQATSEELINALEDHLEETKGHVDRCEQVFELIGKSARGKKCEAMDGLIREAQEIMEETEDGVVRDAGIIAAGQKVEHYEIATYGTMCAFAKVLGESEIADLLTETLEEEKQADETLTQIAESSINMEAMQRGDEDDEEGEDDDDDDDDDDDSENGEEEDEEKDEEE